MKKFITAGASKQKIQPALKHTVFLVEVDKVAFLLDFRVDPNGSPVPCSLLDDKYGIEDTDLNEMANGSNPAASSSASVIYEGMHMPLLLLIYIWNSKRENDEEIQTLNLLVNAEADVNAVAIHKPGISIVNVSIHERKFTPLMEAALCGKSDLVKVLIDRDALINLDIDNNHNNVLSCAVLHEFGWHKSLDMQSMLKSLMK